jgi:hypothetical protein
LVSLVPSVHPIRAISTASSAVKLFGCGGTALGHLLFFSPRREGAKRKDTANDRILVSNLSVLAPLRETSATQAADIRRISSMRWTISPSYAK